MPIALGIDTGGTYTDAVLVDADDRVVASAKRLTTRHDLTLGIDEALGALPDGALAEVGLVALSTTLSTNAVVEGRGAPVGEADQAASGLHGRGTRGVTPSPGRGARNASGPGS